MDLPLARISPQCPIRLSIHPRDIQMALKKLQQITLLQTAQRALYSARHIELLSQKARAKHAHIIFLRRKGKAYRSRSLFEAWNIPYSKPHNPRRRWVAPLLDAQPPDNQPNLTLQRWLQYSKVVQHRANPLFPSPPYTISRPPPSCSKQHRTAKTKLRKLRNITLLCR